MSLDLFAVVCVRCDATMNRTLRFYAGYDSQDEIISCLL
jgi:hypothetical protein